MYVQVVAKLKEEDLPNDSESFTCDAFVKGSILGESHYINDVYTVCSMC